MKHSGFLLAVALGACKAGETGVTQPRVVPARLEIEPADSVVMVGADIVLRVRAISATGVPSTINPSTVTWSAPDPATVTVTSAGVAQAQAVGTGRVVGTLNGASDTVRLQVGVRVVQIQLPPGVTLAEVYGVNDAGMVVGALYKNGLPNAFAWTPTAGLRVLPNLQSSTGDVFSQARAINRAGQITGYSYDGTSYRLVIWTLTGPPAALATPILFRTIGTGINESGQIAVWAPADGPVSRPEIFRYEGPGAYTDLPSLSASVPRAISEDGAIVGSVESRAMIWRPGGAIEFLPGFTSNSFAEAVVSGSRVAGWYELTPSSYRGFVWSPSGGRQDLPTLGGTSGLAFGMNEAGEVVGESDAGNNERHAFRWTASDGIQDLFPTIGLTSSAIAVSPSGIIAGVFRPTLSPFPARTGQPVVWFFRRNQVPSALPPP